MKKTLIAVIILIVLSATSMTAFLIIKNKEDKKAASEAEIAADYNLFTFDSDSITKVIFDCDDGEFVTELIDDTWKLTSSDEFTVSESYIQNVCSYMSDLVAEKDYGEITDKSKTTYGLSNPTKITASDGTNEYVIYVGDATPTGDMYYVMTDNKNKIYSIDSSYGSVLKTSRLMMKDKSLIPYSDSEVAEIQLLKNGTDVYHLTYDDENSTWLLPDEYSNLVLDVTAVSSMINVMTRLDVESFLDEQLEDYSKYGFDNPVAELIVTGTDGTSKKLLFSYYGDNSETYTHVLFEESGQVATFYTSDVDFIENTPADFLSPNVCNVNLYDISGFDFTYGDINDSFSVNMSDNILSINNNSINDAGSDAIFAFNNFYNSLSLLEFSQIDINVVPDDLNPILSVNYHLSDGTNTLFELTDAGNNNYYAFLNGVYSGAIVTADSVAGSNSVVSFYTELTELID